MINPRPSDWTFQTSRSIGASYMSVSMSVGEIILISPDGDEVTLRYQQAGGGYFSDNTPSVSISTKHMYSDGVLFMLDAFHGVELTKNDFEGGYLIAELGVGGPIAGDTIAAMLLGYSDIDRMIDLGKIAVMGSPISALSVDDLVPHPPGFYASHPHKPSLQFLQAVELDAKALLVMGSTTLSQPSVAKMTAPWMKLVSVSAVLSAGRIVRKHESIGEIVEKVVIGRTHHPPQLPKPVPPSPKPVDFAVIPSDALFAFNEDQLRPNARTVLTEAGKYLRGRAFKFVYLIGHTDSIGSDLYNLDLSRRRASRVAAWLIDNKYVTAEKVSWIGVGKAQPVGPNGTKAGRAQNRRVVMYVIDW